jgi:hypothetical protein
MYSSTPDITVLFQHVNGAEAGGLDELMSGAEVAETLGVGRATVERDWAFAKAWLKRELLGPAA